MYQLTVVQYRHPASQRGSSRLNYTVNAIDIAVISHLRDHQPRDV